LQVQSRSDGNTIVDNNISDSQTGLFMESSKNLIFGNYIADNVVQADDIGKNSWNAAYPKGGNLWSDYQGQDEMKGPNQDISGKDGFGDDPYMINEISRDEYPVMGNQAKRISILDKELSRQEARVGDSIAIKAKLKSKYELTQVNVRAFHQGLKAEGYARLVYSGDFYQGTFSTALLDPGKYDIVLSAKDSRGYELQETLGKVEITAKRGFSSSS
jgi:nitrous oxidase accessory protein